MEQWLIGIFVFVSSWFLYQGWQVWDENKTVYHFFLKSGKLNQPGFFESILSTNLSIGNFLVFVAGWGFVYGWGGVVWFVINLCLNYLFFIWYLPVFRSYIEDDTNSGSIHEYLGASYGRGNHLVARIIRLSASSATIIGLILALTLELHLSAIIIQTIWPIDTILVVSVLVFLICCYAAFGGFQTVVTTDGVQAILLLLGTSAFVWMTLDLFPELPRFSLTESLIGSVSELGLPSILGIAVVGSGWFLVSMDNWQRMSATRSHDKTRKAFGAYTIAAIIFGITYGIFGILDANIFGELIQVPDNYQLGVNVLSDMLLYGSQTGAASLLLALVAAAFIVAAISTADTFLIVCGHSLVNDILLGAKEQKSFSDLTEEGNEFFVTLSRALIVGMGVAVLASWLFLAYFKLLNNPLTFFFIAYSFQYALFAPILFTRLERWRPGPYWGAVSVIAGIIVSICSGFGFWYLSLTSDGGTLLMWSYADWVYLTPVTATFVGAVVLFAGLIPEVIGSETTSGTSN